jgi:hypothetical protein
VELEEGEGEGEGEKREGWRRTVIGIGLIQQPVDIVQGTHTPSDSKQQQPERKRVCMNFAVADTMKSDALDALQVSHLSLHFESLMHVPLACGADQQGSTDDDPDRVWDPSRQV